MAGINVDETVKDEFDELQPEGTTHSEFVEELLAAKRRDEGEIINPDDIAESVMENLHRKVELAAYRGVTEAINDYERNNDSR